MLPAALRPYAKLVVSIVGTIVLIALNKYGVDFPDLNALLISIVRDTLVGALVNFGVYQVTNEPKGASRVRAS